MIDNHPTEPGDSETGSLAEGERRMREAHAHIFRRRQALIRRICRAYLQHLLDNGPDTIDPIRAAVYLPPGADPRCFGAAVRLLARIMHKPVFGCPDYQNGPFLVIWASSTLPVHYPG
jgi:hypothetical protein